MCMMYALMDLSQNKNNHHYFNSIVFQYFPMLFLALNFECLKSTYINDMTYKNIYNFHLETACVMSFHCHAHTATCVSCLFCRTSLATFFLFHIRLYFFSEPDGFEMLALHAGTYIYYKLLHIDRVKTQEQRHSELFRDKEAS